MLDDPLRALRTGDEVLFMELFTTVQPRLLRYLTTMVGVDDAADVAGEAWAQALRDLDRFKGSVDDFRGWLTRIARNRALDLLRSQARRPFTTDLDSVDHPWTTTSAEDEALDAVSTDQALVMIASLPPEQAEAVLLRTVMALDAKTAARILGKRPGAVRTAAYRGLNALQSRLSDISEDPDAEEV